MYKSHELLIAIIRCEIIILSARYTPSQSLLHYHANFQALGNEVPRAIKDNEK
jgi:hypothetical protein